MNNSRKKIFVFAGEPSGDLHGSHLLKELNEKGKLNIEGVAGPLMRNQHIIPFMKMEDFAVMGFTDVFLSLPGLIKKFYKIRNYILENKFDAVVLIDYPGFNLRLTAHLRKKGYQGKIIQYISPTVWAWGKDRIEKMANTLDLLLVIYPFEKECFAKTSLPVEYVGHPIFQALQSHTYTSFDYKKDSLIAIFPGSRLGEIKRNFKTILEAALLIKKEEPKTTFGISIANDKVKPLIEEMLRDKNVSSDDFIFIPKDKTYELMQNCKTAIAKSGTVTLELALHNKPTVVVYNVTFLNRLIAKHLFKVNLPFYCIVNIIGKKEIFPELIENGFTADHLSKKVLELNKQGEKRDACIKECEQLQEVLNLKNASKNAASSIMRLLP